MKGRVERRRKPRLASDLGRKTYLILRNHGLLTVGPTVADAFLAMFLLERACRIQILAQSGGSKLVPIPEKVFAQIPVQEAGAYSRRQWTLGLARIAAEIRSYGRELQRLSADCLSAFICENLRLSLNHKRPPFNQQTLRKHRFSRSSVKQEEGHSPGEIEIDMEFVKTCLVWRSIRNWNSQTEGPK